MNLDTTKLYYLSHPYTTHGTMEENKKDSIEIEELLKGGLGLKVINPLSLIETDDNIEAMDKCINLLAACDYIILCDNWNKSDGCREEVAYSVLEEIDILLLDDILKEK